jgi:hypothetical protein
MLTIALSHLVQHGVRLETHEAVALAQEFLAHPCGVPTSENIQIGSDGSVSCITPGGAPSVASVAQLLMTMLPAGTPNVTAPLRFAIARGLGTAEAPAFASLDEFSNALGRFERGASRDVLKGFLQRSTRLPGPSAAPAPLTPTAAAPAPVISPAVPLRRTVIVRAAAPSSQTLPPAAVASPMFQAFGVDDEARPHVHSSRRWLLAAAAGFVASFAVGFTVTDGIRERRAATAPFESTRVSPGMVTGTSGWRDSAAKPGDDARGTAVGHAARSSAAVALETVQLRAPARVDALADTSSRPMKHADDQVSGMPTIGAANANAFSPAFGSDGTTIFFHTGRQSDARSAIEVATADSQTGAAFGIRTIVDDGSHNSHAQPSPDGRLLAFDSDRDGERGVYVANRDGSQVRRVSGRGYAAAPTWSRNSEWLTYIRAEADKPSVWNLWVQPAAGGGARRVTHYGYGQTWAASWFPGDRRIAYSHEDTLMVMDLHGGQTTRYRSPVKGLLVRTPAVSPDGQKIIFQVFRRGVWLLNLADGSMHQVLTDPTAEEFAWSRDGRRIAFHSRRHGQWGIYLLSFS